MILSFIERKSWQRVMFTDESIAALAKDGLLYMFDPEPDWLRKYPVDRGGQIWYFNETRDRQCAERIGNRVYINPMIVSLELGLPAIFE